jgi:hypothetical protein
LGSVTFGQSKDVVIPMTADQYQKLEIILDYDSAFGEKKKQCKTITKLNEDVKLLNHQKHRLEFVYWIRQGYNLLRGDQKTYTDNEQSVLNNLQTLEETIKSHSTNDKYLTDLYTDLSGQVKQAFSRYDWFTRWGVHYLPSITRM